jgi:hypothetical protein
LTRSSLANIRVSFAGAHMPFKAEAMTAPITVRDILGLYFPFPHTFGNCALLVFILLCLTIYIYDTGV